MKTLLLSAKAQGFVILFLHSCIQYIFALSDIRDGFGPASCNLLKVFWRDVRVMVGHLDAGVAQDLSPVIVAED